jgi:hypothetical protein
MTLEYKKCVILMPAGRQKNLDWLYWNKILRSAQDDI